MLSKIRSCLDLMLVALDWLRVVLGTRCLEASFHHSLKFMAKILIMYIYIDMLPLPNSGYLKTLWSRFDSHSNDFIGRKSLTVKSNLRLSSVFFIYLRILSLFTGIAVFLSIAAILFIRGYMDNQVCKIGKIILSLSIQLSARMS